MAGNIEINTLNGANVYIDGDSMLGRAQSIKLPPIKFKLVDHEATGMVGAVKLIAGIEALDGGELDWNSFYASVWRKIANPFSTVALQVRGSLETHTSQGRVNEQKYVVFLNAQFNEVPMGDFKAQGKATFASKFSANYIKQQVGGQDVLEVDMMNNIYKLDGVDMLAKYRANIGG